MKQPLGSTALVYLSRGSKGCWPQSVEKEYEQIKIKAAMRIYSNSDPTLQLVREFEEKAAEQGHQSLVKEVRANAEDMGISLELSFPDPKCRDKTGQDVPQESLKKCLKIAIQRRWQYAVKEGRLQGRYPKVCWAPDQECIFCLANRLADSANACSRSNDGTL